MNWGLAAEATRIGSLKINQLMYQQSETYQKKNKSETYQHKHLERLIKKKKKSTWGGILVAYANSSVRGSNNKLSTVVKGPHAIICFSTKKYVQIIMRD